VGEWGFAGIEEFYEVKILSLKVIDWQGCQGADASAPLQTACQQHISETLGEMNGKWGMLYIYIYYRSCLVVSFFIFQGSKYWGMGVCAGIRVLYILYTNRGNFKSCV